MKHYHCLNCDLWLNEDELENELLVKNRSHCIDSMKKD